MTKNKFNILGIIPARGGSKGISRKNIKKLLGKPLISYTIDSAKKSELLKSIIVSTDDEEISAIAQEYGVEVPFLRPKELAGDKSSMVPVVQHAVRFMEGKDRVVYDYIVLLQPTSPLKTSEDIDATISKLIDTRSDNVYSVTELTENTYHPLRIKKIDGDKVTPFWENETEGVQRQGLPKVYRRNGAIFAFTRDLIMNKDSIFGNEDSDTRGYIMPKERSVDIDSELDLLIAEYSLKRTK